MRPNVRAESREQRAERHALRPALCALLTLLCWTPPGIAAARDAKPVVDPASASETIRSAVVPDDTKDAVPEEEAKAAASPVPVPPLAHYAALWQRSMFTSRALPAPEVPQGPGFADQLVLAGMYEVDGAVVAVILDKMTAQISEARIGSDNEQGIRIKSVEPAGEKGLGRVQLQKGMQSGWIQFADAGAAPAAENVAAPAAPMQPLVPGATAGAVDDVNATPRAPAMPMDPAPASVVQPLPDVSNPPLPASPNPVLDDIPLPPD